MFSGALKAANSSRFTSSQLLNTQALDIPSESLPKKYSIEELYDELVGDAGSEHTEDEFQRLLVLGSCLGNSARLVKEDDDTTYAKKLSSWISTAILPTGNLVSHDEMPEELKSAEREKAILLAQQKGYMGLKSLNLLHDYFSSSLQENKTLLCLLAFTSSRDVWTTPSSISLSTHLLSQYTAQTNSSEFIISFIFQTFLRPLFSKSKPESITNAGRKAIPSSGPRKPFDITELERASRPWKYDAVYSVTVLGWTIENASREIITQSWNLFIPPLLTLLDDMSTRLRALGLSFLTSFLPNLTPKLLIQTGLDSVFEDAITPTLLFLPSLTPLSESLVLLPAAYAAIFALSSTRYPTTSPPDPSLLKFLDRMLRKGIFPGYQHSSTHPEIVQELLSELEILIRMLGIHCVKHLQHIIPMLTTTLNDPFCTATPALLLTATKTLQALLLNAWPRMSDQEHRVNILKALVLCWRSVGEELAENKDSTAELEEVQKELKIAGYLLMKAAQNDDSLDFRLEISPLLKVDDNLTGLFGID